MLLKVKYTTKRGANVYVQECTYQRIYPLVNAQKQQQKSVCTLQNAMPENGIKIHAQLSRHRARPWSADVGNEMYCSWSACMLGL